MKKTYTPEQKKAYFTSLREQWKAKRTIKRGNTTYTERTKNFYVQNGLENREDFKRAIYLREAQGDKITNIQHEKRTI